MKRFFLILLKVFWNIAQNFNLIFASCLGRVTRDSPIIPNIKSLQCFKIVACDRILRVSGSYIGKSSSTVWGFWNFFSGILRGSWCLTKSSNSFIKSKFLMALQNSVCIVSSSHLSNAKLDQFVTPHPHWQSSEF